MHAFILHTVNCKNNCVRLIRNIGLLLFFLLVAVQVSGQDINENKKAVHYIQVKPQYGFVSPHHKLIQYLLSENIYGVEILAGKYTNGSDYWETLYRNPSYGIGYNWCYLGNPDITGHSHALFSYLDISIRNRDKRFNVNYLIQFGMSYLTRKFDIEENPINVAISSHLNVFIGLDIYASYKISDRLTLTSGIDLAHYSNGKIKSPNLGINTVSCNIGLRTMLLNEKIKFSNHAPPETKRKHFFYTILSAGVKSDDKLTKKTYVASSLTMEYLHALSHKYKLGPGIDFTYDATIGPNMLFDNYDSYSNSDLYRIGLHGTFTSSYKRLIVAMSGGVYLKSGYNKYGVIYDRIGIRYMLSKNLLFNLAIRAHYAVADYVEWGIGYTW